MGTPSPEAVGTPIPEAVGTQGQFKKSLKLSLSPDFSRIFSLKQKPQLPDWKKKDHVKSAVEQCTPDSGVAITYMAKVRSFGLTATSMKVLGSAMKEVASVNSSTAMETFTKANGPMIHATEMDR